MQAKTFVLGGLGVLIVLAALLGGLFNVLNTPDCVFTDESKTCTVLYTLPENRSMSSFKMDFQFGRVPALEFGAPEALVAVGGPLTTREEDSRSYGTARETFTWYMWTPSSEWPEIAELQLTHTSTSTASCTRVSHKARIFDKVYFVNVPQDIPFSVQDDDYCDRYPDKCIVEEDSDSSGDDYTSTHNMFLAGGLEVNDCYLSQSQVDRGETEVVTVTKDVVGLVPDSELTKTSKMRIVSYTSVYIGEKGGSGSVVQPTTMMASYKKALYPMNVKYSVGNIYIDTLQGEQKTNASSLDFADQVNRACRRANTVGECTFNVTFVSEQNGKMWIDKFETQKIADEPTNPGGDDVSGPGFFAKLGLWWERFWQWLMSLFVR